MINRMIAAIAIAAAAASTPVMSQTFFSVNAGSDGFNFNLSNVQPVFPAVAYVPVPEHHHHKHHHREAVCVPLRRGVSYVAPAAHRNRKRDVGTVYGMAPEAGICLPGGIFIGSTPSRIHGHHHDYDNDDWEELVEHAGKRHDKVVKPHRKVVAKHNNAVARHRKEIAKRHKEASKKAFRQPAGHKPAQHKSPKKHHSH